MEKEMTPRERIIKALNHQETDRVPTDLGGCISTTITLGAYNNLKKALNINTQSEVLETTFQIAVVEDAVLKALETDTRPLCGNLPSKGNYIDEHGEYVDEWNITHIKRPNSLYYENITPPLKESTIDDLDKYPWPDPYDPARTYKLKEKAEDLYESEYAIVGAPNHFSRIFEQAWQLRGMTELMMDFYENEDFVHALFRKITDIQIARWGEFLKETGKFLHAVRVGDDLAMQSGPLMSPGIYRKFIKPYQKEFFNFIKTHTDAKLLYHCCGAVTDLVEDFIEVGVDILNPVQVSANGMDTKMLKEKFGSRICFWGAVDSQNVLPYGSVEDVRAEVRKRISDLSPGGGYILCSVHNIQPDVPAENILAMYDEARKHL